MIAKDLFVVRFRETTIAFLNFALETFFGSEERAGAVDVDRTAFEDDAAAVVNRDK